MRFSSKLTAFGTAVAAALIAAPAASGAPEAGPTGNGAPSGAHYTLNVIGVENAKTAPMDDTNRHTIFVPDQGNCRINLGEGDFGVGDGNCFDGDGAQFTLPDPDPDGDGVTAYSVYARALGKPGGSSVTTTCFDEDGETYCSTESMVLVRSTGKSRFSNVSKELLSLCLDTDGDGACDTRELLFDRDLADYFWSYDNSGLKVAQLRFYEVPTNVGTTP